MTGNYLVTIIGAFWLLGNDPSKAGLNIAFESGMNIEQIARSHQRSVRAIEFALRRLGLGQDLIINSKDYNILFDKVKQLIHLKIELSVV